MKSLIATSTVLLLLAAGYPAIASDDRDARWTGDTINGRFWRQMDERSKTYYVLGVLETAASTPRADPLTATLTLERCHCTLGQVVEGIDRFYREGQKLDQKLLRIPVIAAASINLQTREGQTAEYIATLLAKWLQFIDEHYPEKPVPPK